MKTIALTWGWSGWHAFPLLALYNEFEKEEDFAFLWVWEKDSIEERIAKENEIEFLSIKSGKLRRYFDAKKFWEPVKNIAWFFQGLFYIYHYNIDIVFSKWGFVSLPLCFAAKLMWKKIYIHESDAIWWVANKIIAKFAHKIFYTFDNEKIDDKKNILTGQIINPELTKYIKDEELERNEKLEVIVIAGSQGSSNIFENLLKILKDLQDVNFTIILWTLNTNFKEKFEEFPNVKTINFADQKKLAVLYKNSDIAITRGSATIFWELYFFWVHSIVVPISKSANNHQTENAKIFKEKFDSDVLDETNNLSLELYRKISWYKHMRKTWLNLDWHNYALKRIKKELKNPESVS